MTIQDLIHRWELEILTYEMALKTPLSNSTREEFTTILNTMRKCMEDLSQAQEDKENSPH